MLGRLNFGLWILATTCAAQPARADHRVLQREAVAHYGAKRYAAAAGAFAAAFAQSGVAEFLFAWGQSERLGQRCARATTIYSLYLSTNPPAKNRVAAHKALALCSQREDPTLSRSGVLRTARGREAVVSLAREAYRARGSPWFWLALVYASEGVRRCEWIAQAPDGGRSSPWLRRVAALRPACPRESAASRMVWPSSRPAVERRPWYRDAWGGVLAGAGIAAIVGGSVAAAIGHDRVISADSSRYDAFSSDVGVGQGLRLAGVVGAGVGAALLALGVWRYVSVARRLEVSPTTGDRRVGLLVRLSF